LVCQHSRPRSLAYSGGSSTRCHIIGYIVELVSHPVVHLVEPGDVVLVVVGQTNSATDLPCQPNLWRQAFCGAMVERRDF